MPVPSERERADKALTLGEAARVVEEIRGTRVHVNTIYRWWRDGVEGVRLECASAGKRLTTTRAAIERFSAEVAAARRDRLDRARRAKVLPRLGRTPRDPGRVEAELEGIGI